MALWRKQAQAGWTGGFDHLLLHGAAHSRVNGPWRVAVGVGLRPIGNDVRDVVVATSLRRDRP